MAKKLNEADRKAAAARARDLQAKADRAARRGDIKRAAKLRNEAGRAAHASAGMWRWLW